MAYNIAEQRLRQAGIHTKAGNHMILGSGITINLENGAPVEHAQRMATHESPQTPILYDRRADSVSLDEVKKIII